MKLGRFIACLLAVMSGVLSFASGDNRFVKFGKPCENLHAAINMDTRKIGWLDLEGNVIIPFEYSLPSYYFREPLYAGLLQSFAVGAGEFCNGVTVIQKGDLWGVIDQKGETIVPFIYADQTEFIWEFYKDNGYFVFTKDKKSYMVDLLGEELHEAKNLYRIKDYYEKKGKDILQQRISAGLYDEVKRKIADASASVSVKTEQIMARIRAEEEMNRLREISFTHFAQAYVEDKINEWQVKGEFEKTADWQVRVNEKTRMVKARELTKEAERLFISRKASGFTPDFRISGLYDADNETYLIQSAKYGNLLVPVPIAEAPDFKDSWDGVKAEPQFFLDGDTVALAAVTFRLSNGKSYQYSNKASLEYAIADIHYNFNPIEIAMTPQDASGKGRQNIVKQEITAGPLSDVDVAIPVSGRTDESTFAVIIANENYINAEDVSFALNDGETFMTYCEKTLGIPEKNIRFYKNATFVTFKIALNWIENVIKSYGPSSKVIFYYAGHGIPDEKTKSSMLLPVDGIPTDATSCYGLDEIYGRLGAMAADRILVFMDSCFSGSERSGGMLASARGVAVRPKASAPRGNMIVMTAAQGDETAWQYNDKSHGMFTYFLLKKMKESKGNTSLGELFEFVKKNVTLESLTTNNKGQTPAVTASGAYADTWESAMLL